MEWACNLTSDSEVCRTSFFFLSREQIFYQNFLILQDRSLMLCISLVEGMKVCLLVIFTNLVPECHKIRAVGGFFFMGGELKMWSKYSFSLLNLPQGGGSRDKRLVGRLLPPPPKLRNCKE